MKRISQRHFPRLFSDYRLQVLALIGVVLTGAALWYLCHRNVEYTDNATVQCELIDVVSEVKGVIRSIHFNDDQYVTLGTPLVSIEDGVYKAQLARADAALGIAKSSYQRAQHREELLSIEVPADVKRAGVSLESMQATVRASYQAIEEARQLLNESAVDIAYLRKNYERERDLNAQNAIPQKDFESTWHQYEAKFATHAALNAKVGKLETLRDAERLNVANARLAHDTLNQSKSAKLVHIARPQARARSIQPQGCREEAARRLARRYGENQVKLAAAATRCAVRAGSSSSATWARSLVVFARSRQ